MTTQEQNIHVGAEERATQRVSWWLGGSLSNWRDENDVFYGERVCRQWEKMVSDAYSEAADDADLKSGIAYNLAHDLQEWCEDEIGDEPRRGLVGEFMGYMLACVDWTQLATDALEEEARQQS